MTSSSPKRMGGFIARAIDEFGLTSVHVVGLDVGSPSVLFAALARPDLFRSLIVGAGACTFPLVTEGALQSMIEAPALPPLNTAEVVGGFLASIRGYRGTRIRPRRLSRLLRGQPPDAIGGTRSRLPTRPGGARAAPGLERASRRHRCGPDRPLWPRSGCGDSARTAPTCALGRSRGRSLRVGRARCRLRVDCHGVGARRIPNVGLSTHWERSTNATGSRTGTEE